MTAPDDPVATDRDRIGWFRDRPALSPQERKERADDVVLEPVERGARVEGMPDPHDDA